jgi:molybdopterin converting factor small subunit
MIRVKVYAPAFCSFKLVDENGYMTLPDDGLVGYVYENLRIPSTFKKIMIASVNEQRVDLEAILKDGDVVSFFSGLVGG